MRALPLALSLAVALSSPALAQKYRVVVLEIDGDQNNKLRNQIEATLLKADTEVRFRVLDPYKRPVSATADSHEVRDVVEVAIRESRDRMVTLLFDPEHNLEERILSEQFVT